MVITVKQAVMATRLFEMECLWDELLSDIAACASGKEKKRQDVK